MGALMSEPISAMAVEKFTSRGWTAGAAAMQGWRRSFEDRHILKDACHGAEPAAIFAVLDGHGGRLAAAESCLLLQEHLVRIARQGTMLDEDAREELKKAFVKADADLRASLPPEDRSGTTVVAAVITNPSEGQYCVRLAHCGDSRAVLRTAATGRLHSTEDHKPSREDETSRIRAAGGSVDQGPLGGPMRVDGSLAVSRAMGDFHFKPHDLEPEFCKVTTLPEVKTVWCTSGDWILLACDGIFDVLSTEEVAEFVEERLRDDSTGSDVAKVVQDLLQECLKRDSKDNCTAVLVRLGDFFVTSQLERELVQGKWNESGPEIRSKYAEFFECEGFLEAAQEVHNFIPPVKQAEATTSTKEAVDSPDQSSSAAADTKFVSDASTTSTGSMKSLGSQGARTFTALAKAIQAVRSTRTIQAHWRQRRSKDVKAPASESS
mmetsp:Transcript_50453/g.117771  ORF Transcript_50453/g.117771 Transcript_50453/m.117771 type:complete len:435 (-) Transcript_50453:76-1380(-)